MYVYSHDGLLMAIFGEIRRYPVQIKEVPEQLKQAFLATEDARFYEHSGIDYKGIARAIWLLATTNEKRVPGGFNDYSTGCPPILSQLRIQL